MQVKITINCDLAVFGEDDRASELNKIFNVLVYNARHLDYEAVKVGFNNRRVFDVNGNEVGFMEIGN